MATTQQFDRIISADSHVLEPIETWWNALGHKFGDRTPRRLDEYQGRKGNFYYTGYQGFPVMDMDLFEITPETEAAAWEAAEKGMAEVGVDPAVRVRFQEEAGVEAEVMNSTQMLIILRNPDGEIVRACAEVCNDWERDFVSHNPKRLIGVSVIPVDDIDWAVKELERTAKMGLRGAMINCQPLEGCPPYRDRAYDRLWAAAQEADIPLTLHVLTGQFLDPLVYAAIQSDEERADYPRQWMEMFNEIQGVLANDFIFGGILDRFPRLKIICSEFEMSWVPGFMTHLDQAEAVAPRMFLKKAQMKASDYMRTRVFHGFITDEAAQTAIPYVGPSQVLWGSDFPHLRSIGLDAQSDAYKLIETLPREDQEKVIGGNAAKLFNVVG
jgi:predicted TIM-barrel fold metal-dependent hydrolase